MPWATERHVPLCMPLAKCLKADKTASVIFPTQTKYARNEMTEILELQRGK